MPDQLQLRGGTTTEHNSFTGAAREVTVDTTKKTLVVHDGSQAGGTPLMRESGSNAASTVQIGVGGNNKLTINSDGHIDIASNLDCAAGIDVTGAITGTGDVTITKASPLLRLADTTDPQGTNGSIGKIEFFGNDGSSGGADVRSFIQTISTNSSGNAHALVIGLGESNNAPTEKVRILGDGKVGIGRSSINALLHVGNSSVSDTKIILESTGTNSYPAFRVTNDARSYDLGINGATDSFRIFDVTANTQRITLDTTGRFAVNGAGTKGMLEVRASGGAADQLTAVFGANEGTTAGTLSNNTDKACRIGIQHYQTAEKPFAMIVGASNNTENSLSIGGSTSLMNGANLIRFYTTGGTTTVTGNVLIGARGDVSTDDRGRLSIDCQGRNAAANLTDSSKYGLVFLNDPTTNHGNGIGFFNDSGSTCGGAILHQDKGSANIGDIVFYTSATSNTPNEHMRLTKDGDFLVGTSSIVTDTTFVVDGNMALRNSSTGNNQIVKKFVVSRAYTMSTSAVAVLKLDNWGTSAFEITAFRRDTASPHGAEVTKLYVGVQGSGSNMTDTALVQETKVTKGAIHTATYSINDNGNFATIDITGDDNGGEDQTLIFYIIANGGSDGEVTVL